MQQNGAFKIAVRRAKQMVVEEKTNSATHSKLKSMTL